MKVSIPYGDLMLPLEVDDDRLAGVLALPPTEPISDVQAAVGDAVAAPTGSPPLAQMVVPGDHVTIVIDEPGRRTPTSLLAGAVVDVLQRGQVAPDDITLVVSRQSLRWVTPGDLGAELGSLVGRVKLEIHDPTTSDRLAYLATTTGGTRLHLNRTVVDADLVIFCGQIGPDPIVGFTGGIAGIVPGLSDQDSWRQHGRRARPGRVSQDWLDNADFQAEIQETAWLLGTHFSLQTVIGASGECVALWAGDSENVYRQAVDFYRQWGVKQLDEPVDLAIACVDGPYHVQSLADVLVALAHVEAIVRDGGRIALVGQCQQGDGLGRWAKTLARAGRPLDVRRKLKNRCGPTELAIGHLAGAAGRTELYLLSELAASDVEGWFFAPLDDIRMLERLAAKCDRVAVIPNALQTLAMLSEG